MVIQQNSRKLLMMDILMSETCWAHKKWNKIASDLKLIFYSSTIDIHFWSYPAHLFLEWEMFQTKAVEKIKTHIFYSITFFFRKSCRLWDNVEQYCRAGQAIDDNMAHAHCMLDNLRCQHTHNMYYSLLFYNNNDCTNAPHCYVIRTLSVLLNSVYVLHPAFCLRVVGDSNIPRRHS